MPDTLADPLAIDHDVRFRRAYHVTPLHYLPSILADGALFAKDVLASRGILPRASAARRDRMLGLGCYVHFSFTPDTPLLRDKLARGYPHVLLVFDARSLISLPGSGLLLGNTKAWKSRACFAPSPIERPTLAGELLVKYAAGLDGLRRIVFFDSAEREMAETVLEALGLRPIVPTGLRAAKRPSADPGPTRTYFDACVWARAVLKPPRIDFD